MFTGEQDLRSKMPDLGTLVPGLGTLYDCSGMVRTGIEEKNLPLHSSDREDERGSSAPRRDVHGQSISINATLSALSIATSLLLAIVPLYARHLGKF